MQCDAGQPPAPEVAVGGGQARARGGIQPISVLVLRFWTSEGLTQA